jgi:hypothetical protein
LRKQKIARRVRNRELRKSLAAPAAATTAPKPVA